MNWNSYPHEPPCYKRLETDTLATAEIRADELARLAEIQCRKGFRKPGKKNAETRLLTDVLAPPSPLEGDFIDF